MKASNKLIKKSAEIKSPHSFFIVKISQKNNANSLTYFDQWGIIGL